jgi:predicted ATPase
MSSASISVGLLTHKATGKSTSLEAMVMRMIVAEYGGTEGGKGRAMARSKKPSHNDCVKRR